MLVIHVTFLGFNKPDQLIRAPLLLGLHRLKLECSAHLDLAFQECLRRALMHDFIPRRWFSANGDWRRATRRFPDIALPNHRLVFIDTVFFKN